MIKRAKQFVKEYSKYRKIGKVPVSSLEIRYFSRDSPIRKTMAENMRRVFNGKDVFQELTNYSNEIVRMEEEALKSSRLRPIKRQSKLNKVAIAKEKYAELVSLIFKLDNEIAKVKHEQKPKSDKKGVPPKIITHRLKASKTPPKMLRVSIAESKVKAKINALEEVMSTLKNS